MPKSRGEGGTVPLALMVGGRWYVTMDFRCCTLVSTDVNTDTIFVQKNSLVRLRLGQTFVGIKFGRDAPKIHAFCFNY